MGPKWVTVMECACERAEALLRNNLLTSCSRVPQYTDDPLIPMEFDLTLPSHSLTLHVHIVLPWRFACDCGTRYRCSIRRDRVDVDGYQGVDGREEGGELERDGW